jgi:hypothetical protein
MESLSFSTRRAPISRLTEVRVRPASRYPRRGALADSRPAKGTFRPALAAEKELAAQAAGTCVASPSGPKNPQAESR